jgi:hypothetical protein
MGYVLAKLWLWGAGGNMGDDYFTAAAPGDGFLVFFQEAQGACAHCTQPANSNSELCRCMLGQGLPLALVGQTGGYPSLSA